MARIKIELPEVFSFTCTIPIRIADINYGNHVGNDSILSIIHEARMQYLHQLGYTELKFAGTGLIMADVGIEFKNELFYGEEVIVSVAASAFSKVGFELYYRLEKQNTDKTVLVAAAKTGMVCYDYDRKKVVAVPDEAKVKMEC
ncbi:MAG: thioesterase family protein [Bacteroidetes bacterium]|nr:thioesterase family protein [Bacteroidota bacterium]